MASAENSPTLQKQRKSATISAAIPDGMMLVPVDEWSQAQKVLSEYYRVRSAFIEFQQCTNPFFGIDRLQTGKQRRRDAKDV